MTDTESAKQRAERVIRADENMPTERGVKLGWVDANALELAQDVLALVGALMEVTERAAFTERHLRREWWFNHGCDFIALYGDDGEMQCGSCFADFKRWPLDQLEAHVRTNRVKKGMEKYAQMGLGGSGSPQDATEAPGPTDEPN